MIRCQTRIEVEMAWDNDRLLFAPAVPPGLIAEAMTLISFRKEHHDSLCAF